MHKEKNMKPAVQPLLSCALLIGAIFILVFAVPVQAEEDTDNLVIWLAERVDELFGRVETLEAIYNGPGVPDRDNGSACLLGQVNEFGAGSPLQNETIVKFVGKFNQAPIEHHLISVRVEKKAERRSFSTECATKRAGPTSSNTGTAASLLAPARGGRPKG